MLKFQRLKPLDIYKQSLPGKYITMNKISKYNSSYLFKKGVKRIRIIYYSVIIFLILVISFLIFYSIHSILK